MKLSAGSFGSAFYFAIVLSQSMVEVDGCSNIGLSIVVTGKEINVKRFIDVWVYWGFFHGIYYLLFYLVCKK